MDDTARLVSELHGRLDKLNGKVAAYQKDILAEFHRHMDDCLKNYPDHVSTEVSRVIAESMGRYPALNLPSINQNDAPSPTESIPVDRKLRDGRKSPPPILYHTSGVPKDGLRSPHEREKEFQGVFTPTYLPLLDGSSNSSPVLPMPAGPSFPLSVENIQKVEEVKTPKDPEADARPQPVRRLTDRSSSIDSTFSDTKVRRSALRRTSSSAKGSPRRVRFEFQGAEVFPSVSPEDSVTLGAVGGGDGVSGTKAESPADTSAIALEDESPAYTGTSLLDVEGEEDFLPRPKKVSSTQALQALSRSPLDADGTVWTMVNSDPDESPKTNGDDGISGVSRPVIPTKPALKLSVRPKTASPKPPIVDELSAPAPHDVDNSDEDESSDEEFLSIKPKSSSKTTSPIARSPAVPLSITSKSTTPRGVQGGRSEVSSNTSPLSASKSSTAKYSGLQSPVEDDAPLFSFEDEGGGPAARNEPTTIKYFTDADGDDEKVRVPDRSPGISPTIATPGEPTPPEEPVVPLHPISPSAALFSHSVGSYKGSSVMISPISNSKLYDQIASMDDVPHFVGGVNGRTGVDTADMGSYRANLTRNLVGTPRSFTERLALDEAMERRGLSGRGG